MRARCLLHRSSTSERPRSATRRRRLRRLACLSELSRLNVFRTIRGSERLVMAVSEDPRSAAISLSGSDRIEIARVARARPVRLTKRMTVEEAFRVTVLECLAQVAANAPAVLQSHDAEGLHQMRVGLRRLQVALNAFGEEFRTAALKDLRK